MKNLRRLIAAALLTAGITPAIAQTFPTVPSGTVIGRTAIGTGPAQAIPISSLIASMLNPLTVTSVNTASVVYRGSTSGTATISAQAVAGTPVIKWPTTSGTVPTTASLPIVLDPVTGVISCPTCSLQLETRTAAAALNLSAYNVVRTMGYATAGDGGGATFKKVGSLAFRDAYVTAPTIAGNGGSGCTNGTYRNKQPTGGTGTNLVVNLTVTGNVVTAVALAGTGGNGYTTNDVVTTTVTGCASNVTLNVGTVSTPTGSFTDAGGNRWQITTNDGNFINVRQFGAKVDYAGTDGTATNDYQAIQNAYSYCADIHSPTIDGGGSAGCKVIHPAGNSLVCGSVPLEIPQGVGVEGHNMWASTLKMCTAWTSGVTFINICNPNSQASCFASYIRNLTIYALAAQASTANSSMVYSNSIQQVDVFDRVAIYAGQRECIRLETGYGGAALLGLQNVECTPGPASVNAGIHINYGTTLINMRNVHVENGGTTSSSGIRILGGFVELTGFHTEGFTTGIEVNIPTSSTFGIARLFNLSGGPGGCTNLVLRQGAGAANVTVVGNAVPNGCTNTVNNAGALTTTPVVSNTLY